MTARVLSALTSEPWAILPTALETILEIAARAPVDEATLAEWKSAMAPKALSARDDPPLPGARRARMRDGVALVPLQGPILRYSGMMTDYSGAASLEGFVSDIRLAADDARVNAIVMEINSPGGEITGITQAARMIRAIAQTKPVVAYADGMMGSAAYLLGAAAREIVVDPMAVLGSLGVVLTATDRSAADQRAGVKRYEIVSSQTPGKRPDPSTDVGRAALQALADRQGESFLAEIAQLRGVSVADLLDATGGGGMLTGQDAVARGLADRVAGFEDTIARLASGDAPAVRPVLVAVAATEQPIEASSMTEPTTTIDPAAPTATPTPTPALPAVSTPSATAAPSAANERERTMAILRAARPDAQALAATAIERGWTVDDFVAAQAAIPQASSAVAPLDGYRGSFQPPADPAPQQAALSGEDAWAAEWAASAALRDEFGANKDAFMAFKRAEEAGKVRVLRRSA